jgi:asparagine synthetase B (glutamine-hydrolysing)
LEILVGDLNFDMITIKDETGSYQEYDLRNELRVNEQNLNQEMLQQPAKYIYWSSILERLRFYQESKELELEQEEARLDSRARKHYLDAGNPKPTKDMVEAFIKQQDEYAAAQKQVHMYNHLVGRVARIVKAFEQRKDMLQSYGKQLYEQRQYGAGTGRFDNTNDGGQYR